MSGLKDTVSRRPILAALGALLGAGVVGGGLYELSPMWRRAAAHSAYDDLIGAIPDRDDAVTLGQAVLAEAETFDGHGIAHGLRKRLHHRPLAALLTEDSVQGRVVETQGWVLPESLALVCGLAAKAS